MTGYGRSTKTHTTTSVTAPTRTQPTLTYDIIKRSFLVLEAGIYEYMSMSEILSRILGGIIVSISILDIIFLTDFHFGYQ
jgi:hypothetical protein